jgi:hypothetical protein
MVSVLIQNGLMVLVGLYMTLIGYKVIGRKPGEHLTCDAWFKRWGWIFKIGGPFVLVANLIVGTYWLAG